jgi:hypothetical protein
MERLGWIIALVFAALLLMGLGQQVQLIDIFNINTTDTLSVDAKAAVDPMLEIARGNVTGMSNVNKFGRTSNADDGVVTDVWDGANATDDQDIWVAPTQARVHAITSTSDADSVTAGGARTVKIYGLTSWDAAEVSETVNMDGVTGPNTVNSYVIIHRMEVLTKGATSTNVGVISATAAVDGTLTAQINAGIGHTQMAIYGVPSTQTAYVVFYYCSVIKTVAALNANISLRVNPEPDTESTNFLTKHTNSLETTGTSYINHLFRPYYAIAGPAIIKIQTNANRADTDVSAGFDLILVNN